MEKKFHKGYIDGVFKAVFCNPKNKDLLKWLIEQCLEEKVEIVKILPPEIVKENIYVKNKTLDVLVKAGSKLVGIEINSGYYEGLHQRNASYIFAKYSEEAKAGEEYTKMSDIYQINVTKKLGKKYPPLSVYTLTDINTKINFVDNLKIFEYNLDKIAEACYNKNEEKYKFIAMLDGDEKQLDKICEGDKNMEKFENEVKRLNDDPVFTEWISAEEDARKVTNTLISNAKEDGIKKGVKQGITETKINTAKKMLEKEMDINDICDITGLSKEEINHLKKL